MDHWQLISFRHYLHFRFNFHSNHSNPKLFTSSRKDWPSTDEFLRWKIKPALVISKKHGLSVLVCKDHTDYDLCMKHFRLPKNPHCNSYKMHIPETFGTCSIEPNAVRHVVSSTMNTSAAKKCFRWVPWANNMLYCRKIFGGEGFPWKRHHGSCVRNC